eukprot:scaffold334066_cov15-Prasinocladus_malaysianus.AAC.1
MGGHRRAGQRLSAISSNHDNARHKKQHHAIICQSSQISLWVVQTRAQFRVCVHRLPVIGLTRGAPSPLWLPSYEHHDCHHHHDITI